jgi:hypothetical protein
MFSINHYCDTDDFIVTGKSEEILQEKVKPVIRAFLSQRGLNLSGEKTRITRIKRPSGYEIAIFEPLVTNNGAFLQPKRQREVGLTSSIWSIWPR